LKHSDLTSQIIGICIEVHKTLGPGLLESIYESAICIELVLAGLSFKRQQGIRTDYKGHDLDVGFRADIIIEDTVILEIKSIESVPPVHKKIVISYLRLTGIEIGLLVNFNVIKLTDGITRLVADKRI
jgi:GxxExxY protein